MTDTSTTSTEGQMSEDERLVAVELDRLYWDCWSKVSPDPDEVYGPVRWGEATNKSRAACMEFLAKARTLLSPPAREMVESATPALDAWLRSHRFMFQTGTAIDLLVLAVHEDTAALRAELKSAKAQLAAVAKGLYGVADIIKVNQPQETKGEAERDGAVLRVKNWQTSYEKMGRERDEEADAHRRTAEHLETEQLRSHEHAVRAEANAQAARELARVRELAPLWQQLLPVGPDDHPGVRELRRLLGLS